LKNLKISPEKFEFRKVNDDEYVVVFNFPLKFKLLYDADDGFCNFFKFQKCIQPNAMLAPNIDYTSENIKEMVKYFSVIEWYCNITEHSYTDHDNNPLVHKHKELLHISFVYSNLYDTPVYKEISKKKNICLFLQGKFCRKSEK